MGTTRMPQRGARSVSIFTFLVLQGAGTQRAGIFPTHPHKSKRQTNEKKNDRAAIYPIGILRDPYRRRRARQQSQGQRQGDGQVTRTTDKSDNEHRAAAEFLPKHDESPLCGYSG